MRKNKKVVVSAAAVTMSVLLGACSGSTSSQATSTEAASEAETEAAESADSDQEAADKVAKLIDDIYVQERTDDTDEQCKAAKEAWDALTDEQKELVEGENADPDYFGRDTGDASLDDPRNQDEIGDKEILVVSFGTSFNDSRVKDIKSIEDSIQDAFPDWAVRRAFTAQIIINHVEARDGECIDNMDQALQRAVDNGVVNLVVQPTHLMHGAEYDELVEAVGKYQDQFGSVTVAEPLLGEVGADASAVNEDKKAVAEAITAEAVQTAGFDSLDAAKEDGTAFVFMGHGTSHTAKVSYSQMASQMAELGYDNVFIGTVEGEPEETACENVIAAVKDAGYKKVVLRPLMVVAGDHANNDMAGDDDDSWKSQFEASGAFDSIDCQIAGLGEIADVQKIYVNHTADAIANADLADTSAADENKTSDVQSAALADGTYTAAFNTDSSMFHVNEANDGQGTLTVKDGKMTGEVLSVLFKGVHYEIMVETVPGTSVTVNMRVIRNHDVTSEDGSEKISANNFYVDLEDVENLDDKEIVALSNAQAWETESDEYISIANIEYELEAKEGQYPVTFSTANGTSIERTIFVVNQPFVKNEKANEGVMAFNFFKTVDEITESQALDTDLKTWANAQGWKLTDEDQSVDISVDYDFDPEEVTEGVYEITFSTTGREFKIHTTDYSEEGQEVGLTFFPEDIHVMPKVVF